MPTHVHCRDCGKPVMLPSKHLIHYRLLAIKTGIWTCDPCWDKGYWSKAMSDGD